MNSSSSIAKHAAVYPSAPSPKRFCLALASTGSATPVFSFPRPSPGVNPIRASMRPPKPDLFR